MFRLLLLLVSIALSLPALAQTHRFQVSAIAAMQSGITAPTPTTWYIRPHGGTRYNPATDAGLLGQCDGKTDADYPGTGVNQPCAFKSIVYFAYDGTYTTINGRWIILGGDTIKYTVPMQDRVGYRGPNPGDHNGLAAAGDPFAAALPPIPSGTAAQPTRIIGLGITQTQIFPGYGAAAAFNLGGSSYVTISGIELTRHSQCVRFGVPPLPSACSASYPLDDYATNGILTNNATHDIVLEDMWIHGFTSRGIIGPIGGAVTATRVTIAYNGAAGWDFDDGASTPSINGVLNATNLTVEFSGCNQAYPGPGATSCYSQSTGSYGDGVATAEGTCIAFHFTNSTFRYNTQDGVDGLHNNVGSCPSSISGSIAYGNNGQQFKWGPANNPMVFSYNVALGNCFRMSAAMTGQAAGYNAHLADYCRASDTIAQGIGINGSVLMDHNTIISYAPTIFDVACSAAGCGGSTFTFTNNIVRGYDNPITYSSGGQAGGPGAFFYNGFTGTTIRSNNVYFGIGHSFLPLATEQVVDPGFVGALKTFGSETDLDLFNNIPVLPAGSALAGLGATSNSVVVTPPPVPPPPPPVVVPVAPVLTWSNPASIISGTALSSTQLNAKASIPGTFVYTPAAGAVMSTVGTAYLSVAFTPTDNVHFTKAFKTVSLVVTPVSVTCTKPIVLSPLANGTFLYSGCH
jgi:hypothetical protein